MPVRVLDDPKMFKKISSAMGKSSSFHAERKPPAPQPPQASPPGGSSDSDNFDSASSSADSLEGSIELTIVLPNGKTVFMSVERRMPMMDLLIHVATSNKISPGSHVISVFNDNSKDAVTYTPSTPIGMLNTSVIYVVPKKNSENLAKKPTRMTSTQPFENTFRLQVHLPRNQLLVLRVSQQIHLTDLHEMICSQKGLDATRYALQHPVDSDIPLDYACSLADYNLTEINFVSKRNTVVPNYNSSNELLDIGRDSTDEKKRKTVFGFVFRRSKSSLGDSSSDDRSSRGVSPTRSDGSGHQSLSPPLSSPPASTARNVVKKRPAPLPPPAATQKQRAEKPAPPPPFRSKSASMSGSDLEHTRTKSDSSVSLDRASLGDSPKRFDVPTTNKKDSSSKMGAASSLSNLSTTSSTTSGVKKRRAPPPPMKLSNITSVVAADCHQPPSNNGKVSPSAAISVSEDTVRFTQSSVTSHETVSEVPKTVVGKSNSVCNTDTPSINDTSSVEEFSSAVEDHVEEAVSQDVIKIVKQQESTVTKYSASEKQLESKGMESVSVTKQLPGLEHVEKTATVEQPPVSKHREEVSVKKEQAVSNSVETNDADNQAPISAAAAINNVPTLKQPLADNQIEDHSSADQQCNETKLEQDQAISMVHEVFQDINQDYSDDDDSDVPESLADGSEDTDMPKSVVHLGADVNNTDSSLEEKISESDAGLQKSPTVPDNHSPDSTAVCSPETGLPVVSNRSELTETAEDVHSESSSKAVGQPTLPTPSLPLSSVVSDSAPPVEHCESPECLENTLKAPVHTQPASSSSHKFDDNGSPPNHHENPTAEVFSLTNMKSTLCDESSTAAASTADLHSLSNLDTHVGDCDDSVKPRNAKDPAMGNLNMSGGSFEKCNNSQPEQNVHDHASGLHISLPDHLERAIQTSPVPVLQDLYPRQSVDAHQDSSRANADCLKSNHVTEKWADKRGAPRHSSLNHDSKTPKGDFQPKLGQVSASFPNDRRQLYQWNDVLVGDSLQSAAIDDDWVSSCSEGDVEEIDDHANGNKLHNAFHTTQNNSMHTSTKEDSPDVKSEAALGVAPVSMTKKSENTVVYRNMQKMAPTPIKSKASTLPHSAAKVASDDTRENDVAGKASTLPFNAARGSYTNETRPPLVPKFKRPLMNFSISTYKSRTEVEPSYETRLAKSESFSAQPSSQQAPVSGRPSISRGISFQNKSDDGKYQLLEVEAGSDSTHEVRRRSSTLPANQQSASVMYSAGENFETKSNMEKASSLTHLADSDKTQVFRTQSVQNLPLNVDGNESDIILPTDREEVLLLQQKYLKLQKQLLHWQQQLLSNQNLLQKQHILPEDAFQLSSDMLLLKNTEVDNKPSLLTETPDTLSDPQIVELPTDNYTNGNKIFPDKENTLPAKEARMPQSGSGSYMKLHMCQPYKTKTDVHGRVEAPKQRVISTPQTRANTFVNRTKSSTNSSYQDPVMPEARKSAVIEGIRSTNTVQTENARSALHLDSYPSQDVKQESRKEVAGPKMQSVEPVTKNGSTGDDDLDVNLPSVKDRVSMLFGKSSSTTHSQGNAKPVISGVVEKKAARMQGNPAKVDSKFRTADIEFPNAVSERPPSVVYSSFPTKPNAVGRRPVTADSEKQRERDRERVLEDSAVANKTKFRRQRFEPAVLSDDSNNNMGSSAYPVNGSHNPVVNNIAKDVQFTINSSASQQRREWDAPPKNNKGQTMGSSSQIQNNFIVQGSLQPSGEKKNITKVAINGGRATVEQSASYTPSSKFATDNPKTSVIPPPRMELAMGQNSNAKRVPFTKKIPMEPVSQDPRSMLLDQIKNFGGRENLRDSRHRE